MPLKRGTSLKNCISVNYKIEINAGKKPSVAKAASLSHCHKIWGGAAKKKDKKNESDFDREVDVLKDRIQKELDDLWEMSSVVSSIKAILNYKRTGKVYPDDGVLSVK